MASMYEQLGVRRVINANGTVTALGGSLMPPEVLAAMQEAATQFVDLPELHERAGARLAALIGVEAAYVCAGAAAGLTIATAACVAGTDPTRIRALPHLDWPDARNEVVIQKTHVTGFAQAFRVAGPRLVEIGDPEGAGPDEVAAAIGPRTAAVAFLGGELAGSARYPTGTPLTQVVELAHARGVPVIVDAAAELPPPSNLTRFGREGADLVIFSGGKGLRGPQCSGLILGRADLIAACRVNANPHSSVGRPMKVGKEEICGLVQAVELYLQRDHEADLRQWQAMVDHVAARLQGLRGVRTEAWTYRTIPQLRIVLDEQQVGRTAGQVSAALRDGDPSIRLGGSQGALNVNPHNLSEADTHLLADRLREALMAASG